MKHISLPLLFIIIFQLSVGNLWSEERCFMKVADMRVLEDDTVFYLVKKGFSRKDQNLWVPYCGVIDNFHYEVGEYTAVIDKYDINADTIHVINTLSRFETSEFEWWMDHRDLYHDDTTSLRGKRKLKRVLKKLEKVNKIESVATVSGTIDGCDYVDLGLPHGVLWATCNVGANKPTDNGSSFTYEEIKSEPLYGSLYEIKQRFELKRRQQIRDDSLVIHSWHVPSVYDQKELLLGCVWHFIENYQNSGLNGIMGVSKRNGNVIFFPADSNNIGVYWSKSVRDPKQKFPIVLAFKKNLNEYAPYENLLVDFNGNAYNLRKVVIRK